MCFDTLISTPDSHLCFGQVSSEVGVFIFCIVLPANLPTHARTHAVSLQVPGTWALLPPLHPLALACSPLHNPSFLMSPLPLLPTRMPSGRPLPTSFPFTPSLASRCSCNQAGALLCDPSLTSVCSVLCPAVCVNKTCLGAGCTNWTCGKCLSERKVIHHFGGKEPIEGSPRDKGSEPPLWSYLV